NPHARGSDKFIGKYWYMVTSYCWSGSALVPCDDGSTPCDASTKISVRDDARIVPDNPGPPTSPSFTLIALYCVPGSSPTAGTFETSGTGSPCAYGSNFWVHKSWHKAP